MQFKSKVIPGRGIGRQLGFPTLNLEILEDFKLLEGVFVCKITFQVSRFKFQNLPGVLFYGNRETFDSEKALEVHILDKDLSEAPESAEVEVIAKIRDVQKFENEEDLEKQIKQDCSAARKVLKI
ncbi:MAG: riboflavin kinase [Patescibacteria group bacterium]